MWKILMFGISAKKCLCDVIWGSEVKSSDLVAHFSRNSGAENTIVFTIQTLNEHSRMVKLTVFTRLHAMKRRKSIGPMLRNVEGKFWTPVNFEVEYFLNEETESLLTDTVIYLFL